MLGLDEGRTVAVAAQQGLLALYLFGSAADGTAGPDSDVDLAILYPPGDRRVGDVNAYIEIYDELAACTDRVLDLVVMQRAPLELQYRVLAADRVLYSADDKLRTDYEDQVLRDWLDFAVELRLYEQELVETLRELRRHG